MEFEGPRLPTETAPLARKWWWAMASQELALVAAVTHVALTGLLCGDGESVQQWARLARSSKRLADWVGYWVHPWLGAPAAEPHLAMHAARLAALRVRWDHCE